jgi:ribosomal RNA-processing protein 36
LATEHRWTPHQTHRSQLETGRHSQPSGRRGSVCCEFLLPFISVLSHHSPDAHSRPQQRRDPRFDNLVGSYDPKTFQASYGFIDQARKDEIYRIRTALKATKKKGGAIDQVEREAMMQELTRLQSKQAAVEKEQREKTTMARWKEAEGKKQADGKKTFYLKSAERKKVLEESRMQDLQKDKRKLHKVMDRKKRTERRKDFRSAPPMRQA